MNSHEDLEKIVRAALPEVDLSKVTAEMRAEWLNLNKPVLECDLSAFSTERLHLHAREYPSNHILQTFKNLSEFNCELTVVAEDGSEYLWMQPDPSVCLGKMPEDWCSDISELHQRIVNAAWHIEVRVRGPVRKFISQTLRDVV